MYLLTTQEVPFSVYNPSLPLAKRSVMCFCNSVFCHAKQTGLAHWAASCRLLGLIITSWMPLTLANPQADKSQLLLCADLLSYGGRTELLLQRGQTNQEQALNYSEVSVWCLLEKGLTTKSLACVIKFQLGLKWFNICKAIGHVLYGENFLAIIQV